MIIVVTGPTAVGKTKLSVALAKKYHAVIINADGMQVYKDLNIGTAKVTEEEKEGVPHLLFDVASPKEMYTVYDYQKDLRRLLETYKNQNVIIVGGTGLYIKAGLYNYEFSDKTSYNTFDDLSNEELLAKVKEKYPELEVHVNNRKRLIRALNKEEDYSDKGNVLLYPAIFIGLTTDRETLYKRINHRVDVMFQNGLLEEVKALYNQNIRSKALLTGIGYKELYSYLDKEILLEEAKEKIKSGSRHYAKRQYTWFNHQMKINWFNTNFDDFNETIKAVEDFIDHYEI